MKQTESEFSSLADMEADDPAHRWAIRAGWLSGAITGALIELQHGTREDGIRYLKKKRQELDHAQNLELDDLREASR